MSLVFKEFLQTSIPPLISVLYAKEYHDFPLKNLCLTVPKNSAEEPFCVSENFWYRKMLGIREGAGITIFLQNCFIPSVLCFRKLPLAKKFMDKREGEVSRFPLKIFCLTVPKKFVGEPFRVSLIRVSKNFMLKRLMSRFFVNFFVSQYRKTLQGVPSVPCFGKFPVANKCMDKKGGSIKIFRRKIFVSQCRKIS